MTKAYLALLLAISLNAHSAYEFEVKTLNHSLTHPWSLAFLPNGEMLVTERAGNLKHLSAAGETLAIVEGVPPVFARGQAGLFEVKLDPDFTHNQWVYLSFAHGNQDANNTRLVRGQLKGQTLTNVEVLFTAHPLKEGAAHYGARMAFMPDKTLLLTLGDGFNWREQAQDLATHFGKIVRINRDGSIPKDNPYYGHGEVKQSIYSYGHRNVQGIYVDAKNHRIYSHEHGPRGGDELNLIKKGINYGWPLATFGVDYTGARISPYTHVEGTEAPLLQWTPSIAPSSLIQYQGQLFKGWQGDLIASALAERSVRRIRLKEGKLVGEEVLLEELEARIRNVTEGPEGALYLLTDEPQGRLLKVTPRD